jgi:hypothetical protein
MRNANILTGKSERKRVFGKRRIGGRVTVKQIQEQGARTWTEFGWLRRRSNGGLLNTQQ